METINSKKIFAQQILTSYDHESFEDPVKFVDLDPLARFLILRLYRALNPEMVLTVSEPEVKMIENERLVEHTTKKKKRKKSLRNDYAMAKRIEIAEFYVNNKFQTKSKRLSVKQIARKFKVRGGYVYRNYENMREKGHVE